jgi:eukaryotic-like serine/threonine-protein kinase
LSYVGSSIGPIRIEGLLGMGGMGEVYLGYDPRLDRRVAVKTIRAEKRLTLRLKERFLREARLLSKIGHPSICQVYDLVETPEADFLVLEYVPGRTLRELSREEELPFERKLRIGEKIAVALAAAHREKIVHRDLKADNVMVTPEGEVKVLDFGVARSLSDPFASFVPPPYLPDPFAPEGEEETAETAVLRPDRFRTAPAAFADDTTRLTRMGTVVGTLCVMSPEQAAGRPVTEASDLFSFGILLQELFTGQPAYETAAETELIHHVVQARTRPIQGLDADLTRLIQDLQNLDPRRRPTAEETAERLRWILEKPQRRRRQRLRFAAVAAAFAFLLAVLAVVSWLAVAAERSRREAEQRRKQAESLIGFMIGDLRTKLEAVDRLDVLDSVGDRALAYFEQVPESQLTGEELSHQVNAVTQIGEIRYSQGNLEAALAAFRQAGNLGRDLVARNPANQTWQHDLHESYAWSGQIFYDQRKLDEALADWGKSLRIAREQLRLHPDNPLWMTAVAVGLHNLGTLYELRGDLPAALRSYRESLALQKQRSALKPYDPGQQAATAATLAFVSNLLEGQGDLAGALTARREYVAIHERLAANAPGDPLWRGELATARGFLANLLAVRGERAAARDLYESGLATLRELAARDPENAMRQRWLGAFHSALGALETAEGNPGAALDHLARARGIFAALVEKDPANPDWRLQLGVCHSRAAAALETLDSAKARTEARNAVAVLEPLLEGEIDEPTRGMIAEAAVTLGRTEAALGARESARRAWERALAILEPCPRPLKNWKVLSPWARALVALDRTEEARPAVERLQRMGYRGATIERPALE